MRSQTVCNAVNGNERAAVKGRVFHCLCNARCVPIDGAAAPFDLPDLCCRQGHVACFLASLNAAIGVNNEV